MVMAGIILIAKGGAIYGRVFAALALLSYCAVIWQRFNFDFGTDWVGFAFDGIYVVCMIAVIVRSKPNKSPQPTASGDG